jgi:Lar family restriction alleviation protein
MTPEQQISVKPCPFCGYQGPLDVHEGSTYRWLLAECGSCEAQGPEVRIDTMNHDHNAAIAQGRMDAIAEWNKRPPIAIMEADHMPDASTMVSPVPSDAVLMRQALDALEYHMEQTRPITRTSEAIDALRARLGVV